MGDMEKDWRLLNDGELFRGAELEPTDGEEIAANAPHLKHCEFCFDEVHNDRHEFWFVKPDISACICESCCRDFGEKLGFRILDGWDIDWERHKIGK